MFSPRSIIQGQNQLIVGYTDIGGQLLCYFMMRTHLVAQMRKVGLLGLDLLNQDHGLC